MSEQKQCCGTCAWFNDVKTVGRAASCLCPTPLCVTECEFVIPEDGEGCPTYKPKDGATAVSPEAADRQAVIAAAQDELEVAASVWFDYSSSSATYDPRHAKRLKAAVLALRGCKTEERLKQQRDIAAALTELEEAARQWRKSPGGTSRLAIAVDALDKARQPTALDRVEYIAHMLTTRLQEVSSMRDVCVNGTPTAEQLAQIERWAKEIEKIP